jgi:hypothetical protein
VRAKKRPRPKKILPKKRRPALPKKRRPMSKSQKLPKKRPLKNAYHVVKNMQKISAKDCFVSSK